jgi:cytochrome c biogenesis protein CcmG/thiol:disulfide interchange protein DsbE
VTRRQVIGFVVVLSLIALGLVIKSRGKDTNNAADLGPLRQAAKLAPCPAGVGPKLPPLTLPCLGDGKAVALRGAAPGMPTLVNIWATWCGPCVREVPTLIAFQRKAAGKVAVVGIDTEDESDKALTFASQYSMRYPSLVDVDGKVLRAYGVGPPVTLFVGPDGRVEYTQQGELHSVAEIEKLVTEHLGITL